MLHHWFRSILLVIIVFCSLQAADFAVRGTKIYDPNGNEFIMRGTNVQGMRYGWSGNIVNDVNAIVDVWGMNTIRVNCAIGTMYWQGTDVSVFSYYQTIPEMDAIVNAFTARGVVVMFEWHDKTGDYFEGQDLVNLKNSFTQLANRHKNNPFVWYNVMNEPGSINYEPQRWLNVHQAIISLLRNDLGVTAPIVIDGGAWGQDNYNWSSELVSASMILDRGNDIISFNNRTYGNIIFSFHTYGLWNYGDLSQATTKMRDYVERAQAKNLCLIVGEWGVGEGNYNFQQAMHATMQVCKTYKIGRLSWAWGGQDDFNLTTSGNGGGATVQLDSQGKPSNLTKFGQLAWDDLRHPTNLPAGPNIILQTSYQGMLTGLPSITAYAQVAARNPGVNDTINWSALVKPAAATITFGNPSSLSPGFSTTMAGEYLLRITITDRYGQSASAETAVIISAANNNEIVSNGSFELGLTAWSTIGGTNTVVSTVSYTGQQSLHLGSDWSWVQQSVPPLKANTRYRLRAAAKLISGNSMVGVKSGTFNEVLNFSDNSQWNQQEIIFTTPANPDTWAEVYLAMNGAGSTHLDGISLQELPAASPDNQAPTVHAGTDAAVTLPALAILDGTVSDDSLPIGSTVTTTWMKVSGVGTVMFGNAAAVDTTASFSAAGTYVLRLTASDSLLSASDDMQVVVNAATANQPPILSFSTPLNGASLVAPANLAVVVAASDAGGSVANITLYLNGALVRQDNVTPYEWGAGDAALNGLAVGSHVLRAVATDNLGAQSETSITITVSVANVAPSVSAGPDRTITLPATASLDGTVTNDGLPVGAAVTSTWSKVSGPGTVTFGNTAAVDTTAAFSVAGTYVLRLSGSDSLLSASDDMQVVVNAATGIPAGWSSQDLGTTMPAGSALGDGADWTIRGGGPDIWNTADGARFAWQSLTGDGDLVVRVVSQTNTNAWAKAGLMIRESSAAGSRHISLFVTPGNGVSLQHRANTNGSSSSLAGPKRVAAPTWLKLTRRGSVFTGWQSANGTTWTLVGSRTVAIPASALVGMAVTSRTTTTLSTAVFAGFSALPMANN